MGTYREAEFYNEETWMGKASYAPPFVRGYIFAWVRRFRRIARVIAPDEEILDLGCGSGVLAAFLWHKIEHRARYVGVDFNEPMIKKAIAGNGLEGHQLAKFYVRRAEEVTQLLEDFWGDKKYPTILTAETLEHVEDDLGIVASIPSGLRCIITVPCHDDPAHVRWFPTVKDVVDRYGAFFEGFSVERFYTDKSRTGVPKFDNLCVGIKK